MRQSRIVMLAAFVVLAFAAITTAAQAVQGPYWTLEGKRLAKGETREIIAEATEAFVLTAGTIKVTCGGVDVEGANIKGSNGANPGTNEGKVLFTKCKVEGNGAACNVKGGKVITK